MGYLGRFILGLINECIFYAGPVLILFLSLITMLSLFLTLLHNFEHEYKWSEWDFLQAQWIFVCSGIDLISSLAFLINGYRFECLKSQIIQERKRRIRQGLMKQPKVYQCCCSKQKGRGLRFREFVFILSKPSYLAICISSLMMVFWFHSLQAKHFLANLDYDLYKRHKHSLFNILNYGLLCLMTFLWHGILVLIATSLSISGYFYYSCGCCQSKLDDEDPNQPDVELQTRV